MKIGPEDISDFPAMRKRLLVAAVSLETLIWIGDATDEACTAALLRMFGTKKMVDVDTFAFIDDIESQAQHESYLFNMCNSFPHASESVPLQRILRKKVRERFEGYMDRCQSGEFSGALCLLL